jgi:hypothetical protein
MNHKLRFRVRLRHWPRWELRGGHARPRWWRTRGFLTLNCGIDRSHHCRVKDPARAVLVVAQCLTGQFTSDSPPQKDRPAEAAGRATVEEVLSWTAKRAGQLSRPTLLVFETYGVAGLYLKETLEL